METVKFNIKNKVFLFKIIVCITLYLQANKSLGQSNIISDDFKLRNDTSLHLTKNYLKPDSQHVVNLFLPTYAEHDFIKHPILKKDFHLYNSYYVSTNYIFPAEYSEPIKPKTVLKDTIITAEKK